MLMAHAARSTLVTVEEIVDGNLLEDAARSGSVLPAIYVTGVAIAKRGAWPLAFAEHVPDGRCSRKPIHDAGPHTGWVRPVPRRVGHRCARRCMIEVSRTELLITVIARLLAGLRVMSRSALRRRFPARAHFSRARSPPAAMRVTVLGSTLKQFLHQRRRRTVRPRSAGQDRRILSRRRADRRPGQHQSCRHRRLSANDERWPGCFGSAYLYFLVPRVILFREEHTRRVMVPKVDFVSAPGVSDGNVHRTGGPCALLTGLALFAFDKSRRRFRLESVHPGHSLEEIRDNTGFDFDCPKDVPARRLPTPPFCRHPAASAATLRKPIRISRPSCRSA